MFFLTMLPQQNATYKLIECQVCVFDKYPKHYIWWCRVNKWYLWLLLRIMLFRILMMYSTKPQIIIFWLFSKISDLQKLFSKTLLGKKYFQIYGLQPINQIKKNAKILTFKIFLEIRFAIFCNCSTKINHNCNFKN